MYTKVKIDKRKQRVGSLHHKWVPFVTRRCVECDDEFTIKDSIRNKTKETCSKSCSLKGQRNGFCGKTHSLQTRKKISQKSKRRTDFKTDEFSEAVSKGTKLGIAKSSWKEWGNLNAAWETKYGKQKALALRAAANKNLREKMSGKDNPMYGKPAPKGSGRGWSGYLDGVFFRSITELSFLYQLIEQRITFENAEKSMYKIPYVDLLGHDRTYVADYVIGRILVEIKPARVKALREVKHKQKYAEEWCRKQGMQYEIISPVMIPHSKIILLVDSGRIQWVGKSQLKYKTLCQRK